MLFNLYHNDITNYISTNKKPYSCLRNDEEMVLVLDETFNKKRVDMTEYESKQSAFK
jgi:hypothetical protein